MPKFYDYLTNFIFIEDTPDNSDLIFIPGSAFGEIAENAAGLYHAGFASKILVSGKYSKLTGYFEGAVSPKRYLGQIFQDECSFLTHVLRENGVPEAAILRENESTYTYENAINAKKLTDSLKLPIHTAIISCQAYHARRSLLYYQLLFPEVRFLVCPVVTRDVSRDNWHRDPDKIDLVLGEVERCGSQFHNILKNTL